MKTNLDLNLFKVLDAIYREGSITKAAQKLNLTQSAVSQSLARLRVELNDEVFVRERGGMAPTFVTRGLIGEVQAMLFHAQAAVSTALQFEPRQAKREFALGMTPLFEAAILPTLVEELSVTAPDITIRAVDSNSDTLEADLAAGRLDIAIDTLLPPNPILRHCQITKDYLVVVSRRDHPQINKRLSLETYLQLNHIDINDGFSGPNPIDAALHQMDRARRITLRSRDSYSSCRIVERSNLLVTMTMRYAALLNLEMDTKLWQLPLSIPPATSYMYWHQRYDQDPSNLWLRENVIAAIRRAFELFDKAAAEKVKTRRND
jgi:DNA-binding transcriptional LysR family regulator